MIIPLYLIILLFAGTCVFPLQGITALLSILILGDRQAGHLHAVIESVPIYITETVLAALIIRLLFQPWKLGKARNPGLSWIGFYMISLLSVLRGFLLYAPMQVIRDSALVYYSLFTHFFKSIISKDIRQLKIVGICLAHMVLLKAILTYTDWTFFYQEGSAVSMYFVCAAILSFMTYPQWSRCYWWYPSIIFIVYQITVIVFRSAWIGFALGFLFFLWSAWQFRFSTRHRIVVCALIFIGAGLGFVCPPKNRFQKPAGRTDLVQMTETLKIASGHGETCAPTPLLTAPSVLPPVTSQPSGPQSPPPAPVVDKHNLVLTQLLSFSAGIQSSNSSTRVWLAQDLIEELFEIHLPFFENISMDLKTLHIQDRQRISRQLNVPFILESERRDSWKKTMGWGNVWIRRFFGIPFGKTFLPPRLFYWMDTVGRYDPHDSFLSILYRTGIVGFLLFIGILIAEIRLSYHHIQRLSDVHRLWLLGTWGALLGLCGDAAFSVSLENAFKGIFYWILLGCIRALNRL